jgi:hypothetical protein
VASISGSVNDPKKDISQAFLSPMGITDVWDTGKITGDVAKTTQSGMQAFFFGLVGGFLLFAVAVVLLYGSFLIAARAILFIFLMLTAALAFATYLVPSFANGEYGWSSWWKALINNAIFAPLLMLFLAVSLAIVTAGGKYRLVTCGQNSCTSDLGKIIADPANQLQSSAGWSAILIYIIGIGLLFISFRMASKFAGTISGFNMAAMIPGLGLRVAAFGGASMFSGALRNFAGRNAADRSMRLEGQIKQKTFMAANPGLDAATRALHQRELASLQKKKSALDARASRDFNILNNALGKSIVAPLGVDVTKNKGGFMGPRKAAAEQAAKDTQGLAISRGDASKEAQRMVAEQQKDTRDAITSQKQASEALVSAARDLAEAEKKQSSHQTDLERAVGEANKASQQRATIEDQHTNGIISKAQRDQQIQAEDAKIKNAHSGIVAARAGLKAIDDKHLGTPEVKGAQSMIKDAERQLSELNRTGKRQVEVLADKVVEQGLKNAEVIAADIHHLDKYEANIASKQIRKTYGNKRLTDTLKALQNEDGAGNTPKTP